MLHFSSCSHDFSNSSFRITFGDKKWSQGWIILELCRYINHSTFLYMWHVISNEWRTTIFIAIKVVHFQEHIKKLLCSGPHFQYCNFSWKTCKDADLSSFKEWVCPKSQNSFLCNGNLLQSKESFKLGSDFL